MPLQESVIEFDTSNPVAIFGVNNAHISRIKSHFPKLKILARGTQIIAKGDEDELQHFNAKFALIVEHYKKHNHLTESTIDMLLSPDGERLVKSEKFLDEVLVHGAEGNLIKARTPNQQKMVHVVNENDMLFAVGPAGTGKTYTAVALAVRALKNKEVKRIILTRPAVEAGENLGFLPGDLKEKLDPYLMPLYDALRDMIPDDRLEAFIERGIVQIAPLAFMRGRTLDNAFVILDEAQNATFSQMKMFLTRMGKSAKFIITGDQSQIDLPRKSQSGLIHALNLLEGVNGIGVVHLDGSDVIRHKLVKAIIKAYETYEEDESSQRRKHTKND